MRHGALHSTPRPRSGINTRALKQSSYRTTARRALWLVSLLVSLGGCSKKEASDQRSPHIDRAVALLRSAPEEALRELSQLPEPWPSGAWYVKALAHEARKENDLATAAFSKALELEPTLSDVRRAYAAMLIRQGKVDEGRSQLRTAREKAPKDLLSALMLAACAIDSSSRAEALGAMRAWKDATQGDDVGSPAEYLLATAALESDQAKSKEMARAAGNAPLLSVEASLGLSRIAVQLGNRRFASPLLNKLARSTKDHSKLEQVAELAAAINDLVASGAALEQLPVTNPKLGVVVMRGKHALAAKRPAEAEKLFERALEMLPADGQAERNRIELHLASARAANGQRPRAIETLEALLERTPDDKAAIVLLSHLELVTERAPAGVGRLAALVRKDPNDVEALRLLANAQLVIDDAASAEASVRRLIALAPKDASLPPKLASALVAQKRSAAAIGELQASLERFPGDLGIVRALAVLLAEQRRGDDAIRLVEATSNANNRIDTSLLLAEVHGHLGQQTEQLQTLLTLVEHAPTDDRTWEAIARIIRSKRGVAATDLERLETALQKALDHDPASSKFKARLAALKMQRGKREEASKLYAEFVGSNSDDPVALNNAAMLLCEHAATRDQAIKLAERAKELAPDSPAVLDTLGWTLVQRGSEQDLKRAVSVLTRAAARLQSPEVTFHLGVAKLKSGETDEGKRLIRTAIAEAPDEHWRADAEQLLSGRTR